MKIPLGQPLTGRQFFALLAACGVSLEHPPYIPERDDPDDETDEETDRD